MDVYIPIDQMPKTCSQCPLCCVGNSSDWVDPRWCNFGLWDYCEWHKSEKHFENWSTQRHPNCLLKPIEQWRLESCKTCELRSTYMCRNRYDGIETHDPHGDTTCKDWQEKVNE